VLSASQTFSDRGPFAGPSLSPRAPVFQENSICQIPYNQNFGKPEITRFTQMRHEINSCEKL